MLLRYIRDQHPRSYRGIEEARAINSIQFDAIANQFVRWLVRATGEDGIMIAADAFVQFSTEVNLAQARYEVEQKYQHKSFAEVYADHYSHNETMHSYLWGIYLTNFLWAHHLEISILYREQFLPKLSLDAEIVEIAPGHGGWGVWALNELPNATLRGFDISPASIQIATQVSRAAGVDDRATYLERDALDLSTMPAHSADAIICSFLVEHLEQPEKLFAVVHHLLKPQGKAFITGALTAAQVDHIYEFRRESELIRMCEDHGLRSLMTLSAAPGRTLANAQFLPRSMAMILQKRRNEFV